MRRGLVKVGLVLVAIALSASLLVACGGGEPSVSDDATKELDAQVTAVRNAVVARDATGAEQALATLRTSVDRLHRAGDLSDSKAAEILSAAHGVDTQLVSITTTTTTTTTIPPPKATTAPATNSGNGNGNDQNGNKGKGSGKEKG